MQAEAVKIFSGDTKLSTIKKLNDETAYEYYQIDVKSKSLNCHEIFHNRYPEYHSGDIPQELFNIHNHDV